MPKSGLFSNSLFHTLFQHNLISRDGNVKATHDQILAFREFLVDQAKDKTTDLYKKRKKMVDEVCDLLKEGDLSSKEMTKLILLLRQLNLKITPEGTLENNGPTQSKPTTLGTPESKKSAKERRLLAEEKRLKVLHSHLKELDKWLEEISKPGTKVHKYPVKGPAESKKDEFRYRARTARRNMDMEKARQRLIATYHAENTKNIERTLAKKENPGRVRFTKGIGSSTSTKKESVDSFTTAASHFSSDFYLTPQSVTQRERNLAKKLFEPRQTYDSDLKVKKSAATEKIHIEPGVVRSVDRHSKFQPTKEIEAYVSEPIIEVATDPVIKASKSKKHKSDSDLDDETDEHQQGIEIWEDEGKETNFAKLGDESASDEKKKFRKASEDDDSKIFSDEDNKQKTILKVSKKTVNTASSLGDEKSGNTAPKEDKKVSQKTSMDYETDVSRGISKQKYIEESEDNNAKSSSLTGKKAALATQRDKKDKHAEKDKHGNNHQNINGFKDKKQEKKKNLGKKEGKNLYQTSPQVKKGTNPPPRKADNKLRDTTVKDISKKRVKDGAGLERNFKKEKRPNPNRKGIVVNEKTTKKRKENETENNHDNTIHTDRTMNKNPKIVSNADEDLEEDKHLSPDDGSLKKRSNYIEKTNEKYKSDEDFIMGGFVVDVQVMGKKDKWSEEHNQSDVGSASYVETSDGIGESLDLDNQLSSESKNSESCFMNQQLSSERDSEPLTLDQQLSLESKINLRKSKEKNKSGSNTGNPEIVGKHNTKSTVRRRKYSENFKDQNRSLESEDINEYSNYGNLTLDEKLSLESEMKTRKSKERRKNSSNIDKSEAGVNYNPKTPTEASASSINSVRHKNNLSEPQYNDVTNDFHKNEDLTLDQKLSLEREINTRKSRERKRSNLNFDIPKNNTKYNVKTSSGTRNFLVNVVNHQNNLEETPSEKETAGSQENIDLTLDQKLSLESEIRHGKMRKRNKKRFKVETPKYDLNKARQIPVGKIIHKNSPTGLRSNDETDDSQENTDLILGQKLSLESENDSRIRNKDKSNIDTPKYGPNNTTQFSAQNNDSEENILHKNSPTELRRIEETDDSKENIDLNLDQKLNLESEIDGRIRNKDKSNVDTPKYGSNNATQFSVRNNDSEEKIIHKHSPTELRSNEETEDSQENTDLNQDQKLANANLTLYQKLSLIREINNRKSRKREKTKSNVNTPKYEINKTPQIVLENEPAEKDIDSISSIKFKSNDEIDNSEENTDLNYDQNLENTDLTHDQKLENTDLTHDQKLENTDLTHDQKLSLETEINNSKREKTSTNIDTPKYRRNNSSEIPERNNDFSGNINPKISPIETQSNNETDDSEENADLSLDRKLENTDLTLDQKLSLESEINNSKREKKSSIEDTPKYNRNSSSQIPVRNNDSSGNIKPKISPIEPQSNNETYDSQENTDLTYDQKLKNTDPTYDQQLENTDLTLDQKLSLESEINNSKREKSSNVDTPKYMRNSSSQIPVRNNDSSENINSKISPIEPESNNDTDDSQENTDLTYSHKLENTDLSLDEKLSLESEINNSKSRQMKKMRSNVDVPKYGLHNSTQIPVQNNESSGNLISNISPIETLSHDETDDSGENTDLSLDQKLSLESEINNRGSYTNYKNSNVNTLKSRPNVTEVPVRNKGSSVKELPPNSLLESQSTNRTVDSQEQADLTLDQKLSLESETNDRKSMKSNKKSSDVNTLKSKRNNLAHFLVEKGGSSGKGKHIQSVVELQGNNETDESQENDGLTLPQKKSSD